jgi:ferredoxin-NADP reductase
VNVQQRYFDAVVLERHALTERILELQLGIADGRALPLAEAGSHIELRFGGSSGSFLRHYSLVGPLNLEQPGAAFYRIAVQREDRSRGSAYIHSQFRGGTRVKLSGPMGAFRLARNLPHVLLIAGGIGITPILPMLRSLVIRQQSFSMLYSGTRRESMAYADAVLEMAGDRVVLHESGRDGRVNLETLLACQPPETVVYICGPARMIEALRTAARALSWQEDRIKFEVFNQAHRPEDSDFNVQLKSGRIINVGAGMTILEALENAGVDTLSDCRRGECGLCLTDVINAFEGIDHRDSVLCADDRATSRQLTICCSRAKGTLLELDA